MRHYRHRLLLLNHGDKFRYGDLRDKSPLLFGISLYQQKSLELHLGGRRPFNARGLFDATGAAPPNTPYLSQIPCSWGAVYFPEHWREFHTYVACRLTDSSLSLTENVVPNVRSNRWKQSWKKYFIEMAFMRGYTMLYPNYANFSSLSTNHLEPGAHVKRLPRAISEKKRAQFDLPLMPLPNMNESGILSTGLLDLPESGMPAWLHRPINSVRCIVFTLPNPLILCSFSYSFLFHVPITASTSRFLHVSEWTENGYMMMNSLC